jgi:glucose 1-dehydrogenase
MEVRMSLEGKVAIVTGASSGIGQAVAIRLGREGANVCINFLSGPDRAEATRLEIAKLERRAIAVQADVSVVADARRLIAETVAQLGRVDILVNNAGIEIKQPFLDVTEDAYDKVLTVNLKGAFFCAQAAAAQMVRQGSGGRIVNISSVHEDLPMPGNSPYCASKGGMRMLTRTICLELAQHGITVNDVGPGAIATPINTDTLKSPTALNALLEEIPQHRIGTPEEVAGLVAYLCSPEAAYVTGSTYFIDGGLMQATGGL